MYDHSLITDDRLYYLFSFCNAVFHNVFRAINQIQQRRLQQNVIEESRRQLFVTLDINCMYETSHAHKGFCHVINFLSLYYIGYIKSIRIFDNSQLIVPWKSSMCRLRFGHKNSRYEDVLNQVQEIYGPFSSS